MLYVEYKNRTINNFKACLILGFIMSKESRRWIIELGLLINVKGGGLLNNYFLLINNKKLKK